MTRKPLSLAIALSLIPGATLTVAAATLGLVTLQLLTGRSCHQPGYPLERMRLKAVAVATEQFAVVERRCPSGIAELIAARYLDPHSARGAFGGAFQVACRDNHDEPVVKVRSAGPDRTFGTADDLVVER